MEFPLSYFSGGPSKIPNEVLEQVSRDVVSYGSTGVGVLEISHRSPAFADILQRAKASASDLLKVPANYRILFMPGGGSGQFSAVALNLLGRTGTADYIVTGTWSKNAAAEAAKYGTVRRVVPDGAPFGRVPDPASWSFDNNASYVYYCDNETIHGVEFQFVPSPPETVPLVCDMSSNICSRSFDVSKFGVIFAGAQKNMGCAGVTLVLIREDLLNASNRLPTCPVILDYGVTAAKDSVYNTPPVYAIHVAGQCLSWAVQQGGIEEMTKRSTAKSELLYSAIDGSDGFYCNSIDKNFRSRMNVVFTIGTGEGRNRELEAKFVSEAANRNLKSLSGHRDVGGMRASIFNAILLEDVQRLVAFMEEFKKANS